MVYLWKTGKAGAYFALQVAENVFIFRMLINRKFSNIYAENTFSINFLNY